MNWRFAVSLALVLRCGGVAAADSVLAQCAAVDDPGARLACYDALAGRTTPATAPAAAAPAAPAIPAAPAGEIDNFGKPHGGLETMTARIVGKLIEWERGTHFQLDNGQVWESVDYDSAYYPNMPEDAEVTITRGALGYSMEVKALRKKVRVKRAS